MELLRETERPVTEICFDVGFNSLGTFSRTFRGIVGQPPSRYVPGPPLYDDATAAQIRELLTKGGAGGGVIFETQDCRGTYERLRAAGVEFTQEPTERFYGTDCALRDPFGNPIRFTQPPDGPIVVPSSDELQAQS